jgi:hypothetical protein
MSSIRPRDPRVESMRVGNDVDRKAELHRAREREFEGVIMYTYLQCVIQCWTYAT